MRSVKSVHVLLATAALGVTSATAACSADGGSQILDESDAAAPATPPTTGADAARGASNLPDATLTADSSPDDPGTTPAPADAGAKDSGKPLDAQVIEAGEDAGGPQGSACQPLNQIQQETCGMCGFQTRTCLVTDGGGSGAWGPWGFCQGEVAGGCQPGASSSEACGLCGTRQKVCQNDCTYAVGSCQGQPANACQPGTTDYEVGLSCDVGGRQRVCSAACTWGNFGNCFVPEGGTVGASMTIPTTVGAKISAKFTLANTQTIARLSGSCPSGSVSNSATAYQYVEVYNPTAKTASVSVWTGKPTGGVDIDTVMAAYNGVNVPLTPAARMACSVGVDDTCSDPDATACLATWGGLVGSGGVTIAPYGSVVVYTAAYWDATSSNAHAGGFMMFVRTDALP